MRSSIVQKVTSSVAVAALVTACGNPSAKVATGDVPATSKLAAAPTDDAPPATEPTALNIDPNALAGQSVLKAKYKLGIGINGRPFCDGAVRINVMVPEFPADGQPASGKSPFDVKCLTINCKIIGPVARIDSLAKILGALSANNGASGNPVAGLELDKKYIRFKSAGTLTYNPPLLLIPNFIGGDPNFLKGLHETQPVTVTDSKTGMTASGTQNMKVTQSKGTSSRGKPPPGEVFENVFGFEVDNKGFDGVEKIPAMLFSTFGLEINKDPMAFTYMHMSSTASDMMAVFPAGQPPPLTGDFDPECGPPPDPSPIHDAILAALMKGVGGSGGNPIVGLITKVVTKLIVIEVTAELTDQDGLKEAFQKKKDFNDLAKSQTDGH